jgi:hypothetical protein
MSRYVSIPREALAELLQALGSPLTPEQYLATLPPPAPGEVSSAPSADLSPYRRYKSRAIMAAMSKYTLLVIAVFGVVIVPFIGSYLENGIVLIGLITVTFFEYRVHRYFRSNDPRAPSLGYSNQAGFAAGIVVYCLYHALIPYRLSNDMQGLLQGSGIDEQMVKTMERGFYLFIAALAGGSQFWLACYYRRAQVEPLPATPPPFTP